MCVALLAKDATANPDFDQSKTRILGQFSLTEALTHNLELTWITPDKIYGDMLLFLHFKTHPPHLILVVWENAILLQGSRNVSQTT